jgi:hypothetical protein
MNDLTLETKIMNLPAEYRKEVSDFVGFLATKNSVEPRKSLFGSLKCKIVMSPDFDAPLDDFAEYYFFTTNPRCSSIGSKSRSL